MRKVSLWMQMSLDGYTEGPNGEFDWPVVNEELHAYFVDELRAMGAFLYGRKVYEGMVAFWPTADMNPSSTPLQAEYARLWKPMPKIVFSKTLDHVEWNTTVVSENIADEVARLKQQPGKDLVLFGGADIASTFMRLGLIDEYRLFVHPVAVGGGTRLFPATDERVKLTLVEARTFDAAVVHLRYQQTNETR
jgi:dihydrofolate reductase